MHFISRIRQMNLPVSFLEGKFFLIPSVRFKDEVLHTGFMLCTTLSNEQAKLTEQSEQSEKLNFYEDLRANFRASRSDFKIVSLQDLFEIENGLCGDCFEITSVLNSVSGEKSTAYQLRGFLNIVNRYLKRLNSDAEVSLVEDLLLYSASFKLIESLFPFEEFISLTTEVRKHLSTDRVSDVSVVRSNVVSFLNEQVKSELFQVKHLSSKELKKFKACTDVVLFDAQLLMNLASSSFKEGLVKSESFTFEELFGQLLFYPGFTFTKFSVLPVPEFEALKVMLSFVDKNFSLDVTSGIKNKIVLTGTGTSVDVSVIDTMKSLFDANNDTLSNYATLYRVAKTI